MADKAESVYAQTILNAYPELKKAFKDWTLYSHALSYDSHTLIGAPPLYGGYEYTPLEMNKRDKVSLKDKNNEALLLMPRVFTEQAGFEAWAFDLSWANYSWVSDMSKRPLSFLHCHPMRQASALCLKKAPFPRQLCQAKPCRYVHFHGEYGGVCA